MKSNSLRPVPVSSRCTLFFLAVISLALTFTARSQSLAQGKLGRVREAVRKHDPPSSPKSEPKRDSDQREHSESHENDDDSRHENNHGQRQGHQADGHRNHRPRSGGVVFISPPPLCIEPVVGSYIVAPPICVEPVVGPYIVAPPHDVRIQPVPFDQPIYESSVVEVVEPLPPETIIEAPLQETVIFETNLDRDWFQTKRSRLWATVGSDFDGITTGGLGLHLQEPGSLGIEGSALTLRESTPVYRDHLWIGDVNLVYEGVARGDVRGRIGLGVNWLSDAWGAEAGFNLTGGADLRLTDRLLLSVEGDVGNLGDADYLHGRVNLARRFEDCELMLGADHFNFGGAEINTFFTGIQFRF